MPIRKKLKIVILSIIFAWLAIGTSGCSMMEPKKVYVEKIVYKSLTVPSELLIVKELPAPPEYDGYIKLTWEDKEAELRSYIILLMTYIKESSDNLNGLSKVLTYQKTLIDGREQK